MYLDTALDAATPKHIEDGNKIVQNQENDRFTQKYYERKNLLG